MASIPQETVPKAFFWRRLHSLTGLWLAIYLFLHLLTNSQAALFIGDDGTGFIRSVNAIHELPYLPIIEIAILAFPILIHMLWGIKYLRTAEYNAFGNPGNKPYLPEYPRNHAYTWQRITSWLLVIGVIAHVVHMRFFEYPIITAKGTEHFYMVRVTLDQGLYPLSERLGVKLYGHHHIHLLLKEQEKMQAPLMVTGKPNYSLMLLSAQEQLEEKRWLEALTKRPLKEHEVIAVAKNFGTAELLMVRDTFKMPIMLVLYTLLVLTASFHAFNGLWTFLISWGITLSQRSQQFMRRISTFLMILVGFMGLSAIWLTYWINLRY